jgi:hypothetical protein
VLHPAPTDGAGYAAAEANASVAAYYSYDTFGKFALDGCVPGCDSTWLGDGECDETCNVKECDYDGTDCHSGFGECYAEANGGDYRGSVSKTRGGLTCQLWSHQYPHLHQKTHINYPDAGLGGHNHCRNPDGDLGPWCLTTVDEPSWDYCDVPPASPVPCNATLPASPLPNVTTLSSPSLATLISTSPSTPPTQPVPTTPFFSTRWARGARVDLPRCLLLPPFCLSLLLPSYVLLPTSHRPVCHDTLLTLD